MHLCVFEVGKDPNKAEEQKEADRKRVQNDRQDHAVPDRYTAKTASALQLQMIARSVENIKDFILLPLMMIPLALYISSGMIIVLCLSELWIFGTSLSFIVFFLSPDPY